MNNISKKLRVLKEQKRLFMYFVKVSCLAVILSNSASAAVWLYDPTIALSQGYNDNYRLSTDSSNEDEVSTTRLSGELALRGKSERLNVKTLLRLDAIQYSGDDSDLDDKNNQSVRLKSAYKVTERNQFSLGGSYIRDTILRSSRFDLGPQDTVDDIFFDPDQDVDENIVRENVRRTRIKFTPGWNYRLDESTSLDLRYRYGDVSYSDDDVSDLVESERQAISARINKQVTEKDRVTASISEAYFRPDNDKDTDTLEVTVGWDHDFSESFEMNLEIGGRDSEFDNSEKSSDTGFVANAQAIKRAGLTTYVVGYERNVAPSSSGNQVEYDEFTANVEHRITENLTFSFVGRYLDTESSDGTSSSSDREFFRLRPGLAWRFHTSWVAGAFYRYEKNDRDNEGSGDSNSAFINISWSPPRQF